MAQSKILLDTNTYLRLAQSIHPLLKRAYEFIVESSVFSGNDSKFSVSEYIIFIKE
jgi:hypothetical protein